jgi:1,2-diacylglycerol 3-beta-galactosyltransferase
MRPKITLVYVDSGGGHRAAANALMEVIRQEQRPWDVMAVSIQDLLDPIDFIRKLSGTRFQDVYNLMLRNGWTAGTDLLIPLAHGLIRATHRQQVRVLSDYWRGNRPDLVVSIIPHYNRALKESLECVWPGIPFVTLLTDIADFPPHFWIEPIDQWVICGSNLAVVQARNIGIPEERILRTSGMILDPRFYTPASVDRVRERVRRGLRPELPTGLVLFGGEGSTEMVRIARALNRSDLGLQLILVCGKNEEVAGQLRALQQQIPMRVEGFTREIPMLMELSDFFIGKPGPGSISEALAKQLPVIVQRNAWTMAHERYNAEWVRELGAGIVVRDFSRDIADAVQRLLAPGNYARHREKAAMNRNFAVFEIPEMLEALLKSPASAKAAGARRKSWETPVAAEAAPSAAQATPSLPPLVG